jgi:nickel/cobalt transporter (NiCoT) family protein
LQAFQQNGLRRRIIAIYLGLIALNLGVWVWAALVLRGRPVLLGTAAAAYGFGLRHAVDADHIAAIDNVTRKLMQEGQRPLAVGLFFALGHSSVVVFASGAVALTTWALGARFHSLREIGATVGTTVSFAFLWLIAAVNLFTLRRTWVTLRYARRIGRYDHPELQSLLATQGFVARWFQPVFGLMNRSWMMFPLGLLFGLGFETATEVLLLGMSAEQASRGMSLSSILLFPALFTAGMTLVDTSDGILMMGAYGWAFVKPVRKLYYNIVMTLLSAGVALVVGGVEALGLLNERFGFEGTFWSAVGALTGHLGGLGYAIIGLFLGCWFVSLAIHRRRRGAE